MSKINKLSYGSSGAWNPPAQVYVGHGGAWVPISAKLVGHKGKWLEVLDGETTGVNPIMDIELLSYRAGTPWQGNLIMEGPGVSPYAQPQPSDYMYYRLVQNLAEFAGNFQNILFLSDVTVDPVLDISVNGVNLDESDSQYLQVPDDSQSGIGLLGLTGASGDRYWLLGFQFSLPALPATEKVLFSAGQSYGKRIYLTLSPSGVLTFAWEGVFTKDVSLSGSIQAGVGYGIFMEHDSGTVNIETNTGEQKTLSELPYFRPSGVAAEEQITIGKGSISSTLVTDDYVSAKNTDPTLAIVNQYTVTNATDSYKATNPGGAIIPGTGKYYIEILNNESFDLHTGLAPTNADLGFAVGVTGWAVNTINGNKFAQETGGGSVWGNSSTPPNSVIGLLYDSDAGSLEYFVDGVSRGVPFAAGTITVPVRVGASPRGDTTAPSVAQVDFVRTGMTHISTVAGSQTLQQFPESQTLTGGSAEHFDGTVLSLFVRNAPFVNHDVSRSLITPGYESSPYFKNTDTGVETNTDNLLLRGYDQGLVTTVPKLPPGNYKVFIRSDITESNHKKFTIYPFTQTTTPLNVDFSTATLSEIDDNFIQAHKQWGGDNGGVIKENVWFDADAGVMVCRALGDQYTGALRGVDRIGERTTFATRMGGVFSTRNYFGPGSYEVVAKLPIKDGVASAFWTFHYEEAYPGHPLYAELEAEGFYKAGNEVDGFYRVRNHEIDIEIPTALKGSADMEVVSYTAGRFNTWEGEWRSFDLDESDPNYFTEFTDRFTDFGHAVNDGEYHTFRFDWHIHPTPRVDYFIDDVLVESISTTVPNIPGRFWVGLWFPSAPGNYWAGATADFQEEFMYVKSVSIQPFTDQSPNARLEGETYPNDLFYSFEGAL